MPKLWGGLIAAVVGLWLGPAGAVALNQADTFEGGTVQGWRTALAGLISPPPETRPAVVPDGGPQGAGDAYLRLRSLFSGGAIQPGSRLVAGNADQWAGNYTLAGVTRIEMWLGNFGVSDLSVRLLFEDPQGAPPTNLAVSTNPVLVRAGAGWVRASFPVLASDLTALLGSAAAALANTTVLRIYHSPALAFPGEQLTAVLGVDDVVARNGTGATVPAPPALGLFGLAGLGLAALARGRRRGG